VSAAIVGPATRGIVRIGVLFAFFPPHSETSHLFQCRDQEAGYSVGRPRRWRAPRAATSAPSCSSGRPPPPTPGWSRLCRSPAIRARLAAESDGTVERQCLCTSCRPYHTLCTDRRPSHSAACV
jgi:hypothetical protein